MSCIAITGSSGLIGHALTNALATRGETVRRIIRSSTTRKDVIHWDPVVGELDVDSLEHIHATVHLAGEPIVGRWTAAKKKKIYDSRIKSTALLSSALARMRHKPPTVLVTASAIGFYGNRGDQWLDEDSNPGSGFLADTCLAWEQATKAALQASIRVVNLRIGVVLSPRGGALRTMLPAFRMGLGGVIGTGRQWVSWISLDDLIRLILFVIDEDSISGPINAVAPNPVTNRQLTKAMGRILHRPTLCAVPNFALRLAFGSLADEALLASQRVRSVRLKQTPFKFHHPELPEALQCLLKS